MPKTIGDIVNEYGAYGSLVIFSGSKKKVHLLDFGDDDVGYPVAVVERGGTLRICDPDESMEYMKKAFNG